MAADNPLRPRGKVAVLCSTPRCGWELYVDALDPRLPDGPFLCEFCTGEWRMCICTFPDGGRKVVQHRGPCPNCGEISRRWDYINEREVACA